MFIYNIKKKLDCIFVENHNSEPMGLKRGQTIKGLVTSCVVMQEEQGQAPLECSDATQSVTRTSNDMDTRIGGASVGDVKAGWKAELVLGAIPYKSRVRPLNLDQKNNLRTQIDDWLEQGVIEPSVSSWVSPLVLVKKKDGRTRWFTDLRKLNKQKIKDSYPLTNIQEILHSQQGATVF